ncbi:MAG TPA: DUF1801 domain-containing protein [Pyrinomonadaceae bacterium]|jgi:hypothetical protein|nr:DUF1801 domain-containing protein [Pyrinomonadaceae bacterium]
MQSTAKTPDEYVASLPDDRRTAMWAIRDAVNDNLPKGFEERMGYGMINWVVPHELYPPGYHCDPKLPLGYMGLASQKNYISLYSMCLYGDRKQLEWFQNEWPRHTSAKLDMGKSCIRLKKVDDLPLKLIGKLASQLTPQQWIAVYEDALGNNSRKKA